MGKVQLKIPPFLACMINPKASDWFVLEREIRGGTTIRDLLSDLALSNSKFHEVIFNPDAGTIGDQIDIVLNHDLLHFPCEMDTMLRDGDVVILLPVYTGG